MGKSDEREELKIDRHIAQYSVGNQNWVPCPSCAHRIDMLPLHVEENLQWLEGREFECFACGSVLEISGVDQRIHVEIENKSPPFGRKWL